MCVCVCVCVCVRYSTEVCTYDNIVLVLSLLTMTITKMHFSLRITIVHSVTDIELHVNRWSNYVTNTILNIS